MKKALLVGINDYPGTQNDLMGCVNDITNVYDVLVKYYGFKPSDVTLLADKRATTKAILDALGKLIASGSSGDTLVFHYSGHGSQVADPEGDEADGKDEIICPYDFDWDKSYIKDDDFARIFKDLKKGVTLEVILDSCHSGTGTREMILDRKSLAGPEGGKLASSRLTTESLTASDLWSSPHCIRPRYLAPPPDVALRADEIFGRELPLRRLAQGPAMNHVLWAACRDNQYSADADVGGKPGGAFSYFFCRHIRDAEGRVGRSDLIKRVKASLAHEGFSQVPQLECSEACRKAEVFGGA
ncbi:MAG: caspase family protein [Spirochaetia bacterium]